MEEELLELIYRLGAGRLPPDRARVMAEEVLAARARPDAYRRKHTDLRWSDSAATPLWQWVLCEHLAEDVLLQGDQLDQLYEQVIDRLPDGGLGVDLTPEDVGGYADTLQALDAVQAQLAGLGLVLLDFGPVVSSTAWQLVLVDLADLPRLLALCSELGIAAAPAEQAVSDSLRLHGR
ncbi:hypothetical protein [Eleftheria terrae]|uniref:hypothetical protein n=1 Tax=Eleftheria terrae TaxID=1597781 RepID=UPI00263B6FAF|nr:hypothetical protein [Eleftheria terrae]WKB51618.1 hypothetical protein N7L95_17695 [Eleftheria terrae]